MQSCFVRAIYIYIYILFVVFCMVRAVQKFDIRLVIKEIRNKKRPMEGRSCIDMKLVFLTGFLFSH